jgi:hypothetical protein
MVEEFERDQIEHLLSGATIPKKLQGKHVEMHSSNATHGTKTSLSE